MRVVRADFPDFRREQLRLEQVFKSLPVWAGNAALNFYKDSWRRQGFIDRTFERWPRRRMKQPGGERGLLVQSGALRRSLRLRTGAGWFEVYTGSRYAKAHNEGETITQNVTARQRAFFWAMHAKYKKLGMESEAGQWKGMALSKILTIKMPRRQFMDVPGTRPSAFLERRIVLHVERALEAALRGAG